MNTLWVISLAVGLVSGDIGLDIRHNKVPHTSYGVPSYQIGSRSGDINTDASVARHDYKLQNADYSRYLGGSLGQENSGSQGGFQSINNYAASTSGASYQPGSEYNIESRGSYYQTGGSNNGLESGSVGIVQPGYNYKAPGASQGFNQQYQSSSHYQSSAVQKYQEYYNQLQQQPPLVFKHFYVHAAPEEPEPPKYRPPINLPPPQKHYKIIFIKAPTQVVHAPQFIPVPQQNEEKTIVYVLVNKPEEPQEITLPKIEPKPPTKPEVFFIKYNNKEDSQAVISNIVSDYNKVNEVSFASPGAPNELGGILGGSGQFSQSGVSSQSVQSTGSGQYAQTTGSGQYTSSTSAGQITDNTNSGQFAQSAGSSLGSQSSGSQIGSQESSGSFGSPTLGGASGGQAFNVATAEASAVSAASGSFSSTGAVSGTSSLISTSQGIPHETYGPPKFRV